MNYVDGDVRDQLAHVGRAMVAAGLVVGSGGNLSARVPGHDEIWVTASGSWLDRLDRDCFARVPLAGGAATGTPTSELPLHLATYRARPDATAVIHLHPQSLLLLDLLGIPVALATTDHAFYLRRVVTARFRAPGSQRLAEEAAALVADGTNCVVLSRHGCSVLADSVELAHKRALYLEEAARLTYRAALLRGGAVPTPPDTDFAAWSAETPADSV